MSNKLEEDATKSSATTGDKSLSDRAETESTPTVVDSYVQAVDETAHVEPSPQAINDRLAQLKTAVAKRTGWHHDDWAALISGLTQYSFQVVRSWLAIIAVGDGEEQAEREPFRLAGADVDQLAESVVSRAENGFRDELGRIRWWLDGNVPDMKALHLVECALQLPAAYRDWQLRHHHTVAEDALEDLAMAHRESGESAWPLRRLNRYLTEDRDRIAHLLQTLRYSEAETAEIIEGTLAAFDLLVRKGGSR